MKYVGGVFEGRGQHPQERKDHQEADRQKHKRRHEFEEAPFVGPGSRTDQNAFLDQN
jgi:hypothetical protein